ncbi:AAA family ATPase [Listeria monocytogenes]|nr:AAA family ATPase [Listeria monocytogenes]
MSITSIEIKNFKSIDYLKINISELNALVGKNGVGKTTIQNAIRYFYNNLINIENSNNNFDTINPFRNTIEISIEYDLSKIQNYAPTNYLQKALSMTEFDNSTKIVTMVQKKNNPIKWNINYEERYIIYNSHPIYFCDTRSVDLTNWDTLWQIVGDLINAKDVNNIIERLSNKINNKDFKRFTEYEQLFRNFLETNKFAIQSDSKKNQVISLLQLQLGGKKFLNHNEKLDYFSDGTNSQSYILFLCYIAHEISNKRLKEVTVFLDEPELGLHPQMIDQLMEKLLLYSKNVKFIIFSHSPRLVAAIIKGRGELYKIQLNNKYTRLTKIVKQAEKKYQLIVTEREASCYFSDLVLFVEGISELELFNHKTLIKLFPFLKRVEVINTASNDHILKLFHSITPKIPYLILNDMDKVLTFKNIDIDKQKIELKSLWYSPLKFNSTNSAYSYAKDIENRLKYSYSKKDSKTKLALRNKILKDVDKSIETSGELQIISENPASIVMIRQFCSQYNLLLTENTIEGSIINNSNYRTFNLWRKNFFPNYKLDKLLTKASKFEKTVILRILFKGKLDTLINYKDKTSSKYGFIVDNAIDKNTGWITSFLNFYEERVLGLKKFQKDKNNKLKIQRFKQDFPEIYAIINLVKEKISDE